MKPDWLKKEYEEFVENFDPTPYYAFDDYLSLPDFDNWAMEREDAKFLEIFNCLLMEGVHEEKSIEAMVHDIMDHPTKHPQYF